MGSKAQAGAIRAGKRRPRCCSIIVSPMRVRPRVRRGEGDGPPERRARVTRGDESPAERGFSPLEVDHMRAAREWLARVERLQADELAPARRRGDLG